MGFLGDAKAYSSVSRPCAEILELLGATSVGSCESHLATVSSSLGQSEKI